MPQEEGQIRHAHIEAIWPGLERNLAFDNVVDRVRGAQPQHELAELVLLVALGVLLASHAQVAQHTRRYSSPAHGRHKLIHPDPKRLSEEERLIREETDRLALQRLDNAEGYRRIA